MVRRGGGVCRRGVCGASVVMSVLGVFEGVGRSVVMSVLGVFEGVRDRKSTRLNSSH